MTTPSSQPGGASTELVVVKSPAFGASTATVLPYRADHLRTSGFSLTWDDRRARLTGRKARVVGRLEGLTTPFFQVWCLRRAISRAPFTLGFFESEAHAIAAVRLAGRWRRTRLVVMSCWLADLAERSGAIRRRLYRALYRRVDLVTVFSDHQRPILQTALGLRADQVVTIPFGIDTDELAALRPSDEGYLLAAGRDLGRDWPTLFAAAAGTGRRVVVLTRPNRLPPVPVPPEVEIAGFVDRPRYLELLAGATAVLIVTHDPAYPSGQTVLLEALALGKECITTATPSMLSFAGDLGCTWVPMGDVAAVREAIVTCGTRAPARVPAERLDARGMWAALAAELRGRWPEQP